MRADAQRNHDHLIEVAAVAFAKHGTGVALERIAKEARLGVGTLYRHFPTREALIEAVYRQQLEQLRDGVDPLIARVEAGELEAGDALRAWMDNFLEYSATKRGLGEALQQIVKARPETRRIVCDMLESSIGRFLTAGAKDQSLRADVDPAIVFRAMTSVYLLPEEAGWAQQAGQIFDLLIAGLRPR